MFYLNRIKLLSQEKVAIVLCMKSGASTASLHYIDNVSGKTLNLTTLKCSSQKILTQFQQLYVLAEGECVYSGHPSELNKFFKDASDDPTFPDIQIGT